MSSRRIRLTGHGWEKFTGEYCGVDFENGVSVGQVGRMECDRIAALVGAVDAETGDGVTLEWEAEQQRMRQRNELREKRKAKERAEEAARKAAEEKEKNPDDDSIVTEATFDFTEESLGEIADKDGIAGLRKIADLHGIKGRGIQELINELLAKKAEHEAAKSDEQK